ncbi:cytochrome c [Temperatibacter marinus]|uniref:Cytochrome c n=1 Tax=Temperatibacter marinus TaxID=1456591 RepID=A0AA52EEN5_9PROT|nr:cytochrome c [Temperatibacter marinus]WND01420.1 cytochrome c [Temperatibacter marinus]
MNKICILIITGIVAALPAVADGKKTYREHCSVCHMEDGGGVPMMQPELINSPIVNGEKNILIDMLFFGSESKYAPGESMNLMAGFQHLKDKEIADLLTYIRQNFDNKASKINGADVTQYRQSLKR